VRGNEWCEFQEDIASWKAKILPPHENTPEREFDRGLEEVAELAEAIKADDGSPQAREEINSEAADVVIRMIGIVVSAGGDIASLIDKKIGIIQDKYPPDIIAGELQAGVPFDVAMDKHKRAWQQRGGERSVYEKPRAGQQNPRYQGFGRP
jgi:NTP pyrophosphatase (non-canonical NTP hydrolase)